MKVGGENCAPGFHNKQRNGIIHFKNKHISVVLTQGKQRVNTCP